MATNIVQQCQVAPSSGVLAEQSLKLLHFDILWLLMDPLKILVFYGFPCSESRFLDTIVPNLKNSLSLTLKHFPSLAGKILIPHNSHPVARYVAGEDSVSMTIAVSNADFKKVTENHSKEADELYDLVSKLPDSSTLKFSVIAFQVTLFPNQGVSIGLTGHHSICDGPALTLFIQAWASINKFNGDESCLLGSGEECLPFYDRNVVPDGDRLANECWSHIKMLMPTTAAVTTTTLNSMVSAQERTFHATFDLSEDEIQILKSFVLNRKPAMVRVSSFTVVCAHMWTCLVKAAAAAGDREVADDEPEYLCFAADCRGRFSPPLPNNYFGNCMTAVVTESTTEKLRGSNGFLSAAEVIGEAIRKNVDNDRGIMDSSMKSVLEFVTRVGERMLIIGGSPRLDFYGIDYGWGRPVKYETFLGDDNVKVVYFSKSRKNRGGIEIGVTMPKVRMDAFAACFDRGIIEAKEKLRCNM